MRLKTFLLLLGYLLFIIVSWIAFVVGGGLYFNLPFDVARDYWSIFMHFVAFALIGGLLVYSED